MVHNFCVYIQFLIDYLRFLFSVKLQILIKHIFYTAIINILL